MVDDLHHHVVHYLILLGILIGGLSLFLSFSHQPMTQILIAMTMATLFTLWGIGHHLTVEKHVHHKIVVEYILISFIGLILLLSLLHL